MKKLSLEKDIFRTFVNPDLLNEALTHRSCLLGKQSGIAVCNERLEFLGDAVLQLCISDMLMRRFPHEPEGELTRLRALLVNTRSLALITSRVGLAKHIVMSKGEEATGGRKKATILAGAFESLMGAVYLDQGYDVVYAWLSKIFTPSLLSKAMQSRDDNYKKLLQEFCQRSYGVLPRYELITTSGPDHEKIFRVRVNVGKMLYRSGYGKNKKKAERCAARKAISALQKRMLQDYSSDVP